MEDHSHEWGEELESIVIEKQISPHGEDIRLGSYRVKFPAGAVNNHALFKMRVLLREKNTLKYPEHLLPISHVLECSLNSSVDRPISFTVPKWFKIIDENASPIFAHVYKLRGTLSWECEGHVLLDNSETVTFPVTHFCKIGIFVDKTDNSHGKLIVDYFLCGNQSTFFSIHCLHEENLVESMENVAKRNGNKIIMPPFNKTSLTPGQEIGVSLRSEDLKDFRFVPDKQKFVADREFQRAIKTKALSFRFKKIANELHDLSFVYQVNTEIQYLEEKFQALPSEISKSSVKKRRSAKRSRQEENSRTKAGSSATTVSVSGGETKINMNTYINPRNTGFEVSGPANVTMEESRMKVGGEHHFAVKQVDPTPRGGWDRSQKNSS